MSQAIVYYSVSSAFCVFILAMALSNSKNWVPCSTPSVDMRIISNIMPTQAHGARKIFIDRTQEACAAKDKKTVNRPISKDFADMVRPWLPKVGRLWSRLACKRAGEMLGGDLDKAKIARENKEGVVDFHSLRVYCVTELCKSIRNPKIIQTLARHSTMELTMKIHAKVN